MKRWPPPKSVFELREFLGLIGYYRRFVQNYGVIVAPVTKLLHKNNFDWDEVQVEAFGKLKSAMMTVRVLTLPDFSLHFVIETDASGFGLEAMLVQNSKRIAYFSQALSERAQAKSIYERELMVVVLAI